MAVTAGRQPPLRLTRRGRAVVLVFLVFLASVASAVLFTSASRASDSDAAPSRTVVVGAHDTLWAIAVRAEPRWDAYAAIVEIQRLNGMSDYTVEPGDRLIVPAPSDR